MSAYVPVASASGHKRGNSQRKSESGKASSSGPRGVGESTIPILSSSASKRSAVRGARPVIALKRARSMESTVPSVASGMAEARVGGLREGREHLREPHFERAEIEHAAHECDLIETDIEKVVDELYKTSLAEIAASIEIALARLIGFDERGVILRLRARKTAHRRPQAMRQAKSGEPNMGMQPRNPAVTVEKRVNPG